jgi:hypothetical protein
MSSSYRGRSRAAEWPRCPSYCRNNAIGTWQMPGLITNAKERPRLLPLASEAMELERTLIAFDLVVKSAGLGKARSLVEDRVYLSGRGQ